MTDRVKVWRATFYDPYNGTCLSWHSSREHAWQYLREQQRELSSGQFRRMCKADFLNYLQTRRLLDYEAKFSSPFDKEVFDQQLLNHIDGLDDLEVLTTNLWKSLEGKAS